MRSASTFTVVILPSTMAVVGEVVAVLIVDQVGSGLLSEVDGVLGAVLNVRELVGEPRNITVTMLFLQ